MVRWFLSAVFLASLPVSAAPDFSPVRELLKAAVAKGEVAGGSVVVLHKGQVVFEEGFGFSNVESKTPFEADMPVVVASISKPLLGTAAFRIAEGGAVDLSLPVSRYLPEFKGLKLESGEAVSRAPKMTELLTHTSGMRFDDAAGGRPWFASWSKNQSLEFVVKKIASDFPFKSQPGTRYGYSGSGTEVVARVLEVVTKKPRNVLFVDEVAKPLGMKNTFYRDAEGLKAIGKMPTRYYIGGNGKLQVSKKRRVPEKNGYSSSGGTVISTAQDLAKWLLMIREGGKHEGGSYLTPETIRRMLERSPLGNNALGGLFVRAKDETGRAVRLGHTGSSGTNCWIDFEQDVIGIMLTQTSGRHIKPFRIKLEKVVGE